MTSFWCFVTILVAIYEIEGNDHGSFRSDINTGGKPILRGGLEDLLDNINLDINVRVEPKKPSNAEPPETYQRPREIEVPRPIINNEDQKQSDSNENPPRPPEIHEAPPKYEPVISLWDKKPKSSEELNSDIDEKLPDLRTAGPDMLSEPNETEEALTFLRMDEDKEDKPAEDQVVRLVSASKEESREVVSSKEGTKKTNEKPVPSSKEADNSVESQTVIVPLVSDENKAEEADEEPLRMGEAGTSEWMKDLRSYVNILAARYQKDKMLAHMKPVIKVLERTHKVKIKDIDVTQHGKVKINYVRKG